MFQVKPSLPKPRIETAIGQIDVDALGLDRGDILKEARDLGQFAVDPRDQCAGRRIVGDQAVGHRDIARDALDRAIDLDLVPIGLDREARGTRTGCRRRRPPSSSTFPAARSSLPPVIDRNLGIGLLVAAVGGNPGGDAGGPDRRIIGEAPRRGDCSNATSRDRRALRRSATALPNNSPICGARKPSAHDARKRRSSIGFQLTPALNVVVDPIPRE